MYSLRPPRQTFQQPLVVLVVSPSKLRLHQHMGVKARLAPVSKQVRIFSDQVNNIIRKIRLRDKQAKMRSTL